MRGDVCEYRECTSQNTETETVCGNDLTLCEKHGPRYGHLLSTIDCLEMRDWAESHLKPESAKKWHRLQW